MIHHGISDTQKENFNKASLSHILAISGMHITYIIMALEFCFQKFNKRKSKIFLIIFLSFFGQLTGNSPSILRAVITGILTIISKLVYMKSDTINNLAISALIILIINPYNILNLGFQLSFLGTLGIILFNNKISDLVEDKILKGKIEKKIPIGKIERKILKGKKAKKIGSKIYSGIKEILSVSISANLLIFPILMYQFNNVSFTFLISNFLITPITGVMILLGYATCIISFISIKISKITAFIFNDILVILNYVASICAKLSITKINVVTPSILVVLIIYFAIFYMSFFYKIIHKKYLKNLLGVVIVLVIICNISGFYNLNVRIHFIDVGQGDSTLIITKTNKTILIDGGGSEVGTYDVGEKTLVPYLLDRHIQTIDYMFFSHFDADHCKGLFSVIENLNVKNIIISEQGKISDNYNYFIELVKPKNINIICVKAGNRLNIDKYEYVDILWPTENLIQENVLNNNSLVCKFVYNKFSILFTGDIEAVSEKKLLEIYNDNELKSTILKVAHHGSKSSSTEEFLNKVMPKIAIIGVGEKNKFGHPNNYVLERLNNLNCRTDVMGEISITIRNNGKITVNTHIS